FWPLMAWNLLYAVMQAPIQPLMDSSAVLALGDNRHQYSAVRAFGSLGYAPLVYLTGALSERIDLRWSFVGFAFFTFIAMLVSLKVRSDESALQSNVLTGLSAVGKDRAWQQMMAAFFVSSILQAIAFSYSGLYLDTLHASESLIGLSGAVGSISQTLLMFTLLPWLVRHWGGERLLVFSFVMFALRLAVWALVPNPVAVTLSEALLGLTTGAALAGSVDFAARKAPPGLAATAQSLMSCLVNGLGRTAGSAVAGGLYDTLGPQPLFGGFAALAGVSAVILSWVWRQILRGHEPRA
ncbi:MAG: MFS transporter, partial [Anaerolineales bacterium]